MRSVVRARNTVIEPWVDVDADIRAILEGNSIRSGADYIVGGRVYGVEESGTLFPRRGPGFIELDRASYKALGVYNVHGESARAEEILDLMHDQTPASRTAGLAAHRAGKHR
jgi:hypothetical protein